MSAEDVTLVVVAWLLLLCLVGERAIREVFADFRDGLAARDRRRHIAECERMWAADPSALAELERVRSGVAFAESMALTLEEIRNLPTVEGQSSWS